MSSSRVVSNSSTCDVVNQWTLRSSGLAVDTFDPEVLVVVVEREVGHQPGGQELRRHHVPTIWFGTVRLDVLVDELDLALDQHLGPGM